MKKIVIAFLIAITLAGCYAINHARKPVSEYPFKTLLKIKREYKLTDRELGDVLKDAKSGKIRCFYYDGRNIWMFDATVDYSTYKKR